jgi:hypothetical protein
MGARRRGDPLPTLGDLRKGYPKEINDKGQSNVGRELSDFRICNYDETDEQLVEFIKTIGTLNKNGQQFYTANHLQFVFPEPTVAGNLMVFNECYKGGILIHRCTPDEDRIVVRALDPQTFAPIVVNGRDVRTGDVVHCDDRPLYTYQGKNGIVHVGCSPVVRMKVMLRGQGRIGTWDVLSTSGIDGEHLQLQLETFYSAFSSNPILKDNGLRGIPFVLHRMPPQDVPYYGDDGARHTSKHSFISIEIAPDFGGLFMESTIRFSLEAIAPKLIEAPSAGPKWEEETSDEILDQAAGGVVITQESSGTEQTKTELPTMDYQAMFKALDLPKAKYNAILDHVGGDWESAYKFAMKAD